MKFASVFLCGHYRWCWGKALSKDLINLPTLVFKKRVFWFGAGACEWAACFAME